MYIYIYIHTYLYPENKAAKFAFLKTCIHVCMYVCIEVIQIEMTHAHTQE